MPLDMTPEEKALGQSNFERVAEGLARQDPREPDGQTRRGFMKSLALTAAGVIPVSAAVYFGYRAEAINGKPVKTALIGAGDEGGVLIGEHNPKFLEIVAVCDIRPSNQARIFTGDLEKDKDGKDIPGKRKKGSFRKGLTHESLYGRNARQHIKVYKDYKEVLARKDIEAVIIALPLHLHAPVAIDCMKAKKHVLCEKLMAWNITQCKDMITTAKENDVILSIGHQRHYSMLYAHAQEVMKSGVLGDVRHIRALWHRNNALLKKDKDGKDIPGQIKDSWKPDIPAKDREELEKSIRQLGYKNMEELVRWRLFKRTGGGLMAELGSHQLDACSIFLGKVKPIAVTGVGGRYFYRDNPETEDHKREIEDHVFCTYEFPGPNYWSDGEFGKVKDADDKVIVTYSSINTNAFEKYGECVMGSKGTMVVEQEQSIQLYADSSRGTAVGVATAGGKPVLDTTGSDSGAARLTSGAGGGGPVSRGYREEMEHFAFCIKMWNQGMSKSDRPQPRCRGEVAMADAIIALTTNLAMEKQERIPFKKEWFIPSSSEVPDRDKKVEVVSG
jgi:predicted dehydrogenase